MKKFKEKQMRDDLTEIVVILDRSGSMYSIRDDTIGSFNSFLEDQVKEPGSANFTLVQFDDKYEVMYSGKDIKDVFPLTRETFVPRGSTALLDAIGRTINEVGARLSRLAEVDRPSKVICTIITDGQENSSIEFKRSTILNMITHQREVYKWEFIFLSADENGIQDAQSIGISIYNTALFGADSQGIGAANYAASQAVSSYRTSGITGQSMSDYVAEGEALVTSTSDDVDA